MTRWIFAAGSLALSFVSASSASAQATERTAFACLLAKAGATAQSKPKGQMVTLNLLLAGSLGSVAHDAPIETFDPAHVLGVQKFTSLRITVPTAPVKIAATTGPIRDSATWMLSMTQAGEGEFEAMLAPANKPESEMYLGRCFAIQSDHTKADFDKLNSEWTPA